MVALVDNSWSDLAALIQSDFGRPVRHEDVGRELVDWFHYRARLIARRPRQVSLSDDVKAQLSVYPAIARIAADFRKGADMSPWLSDKVRKRKAAHRADLMFNDWQISHLHLGSHYDAPNRVKRTGLLLFAYVDNQEAVLLKVASHGAWSDRDVLVHLLETRPALMERWELRGVTAPNLSDEQRLAVREGGSNVITAIDNRAFMPGLGITASGHALRIRRKADDFLSALDNLKTAIVSNTTPREAKAALSFPIGVPVQLRVRLEANGDLTLYDAVRSWGFFSDPAPY